MLRLETLRKERGLSQKQIADIFQISQQGYSNYENGKREPDYETLKKFANFFEVSVDYLVGNTNDPTPADKKEEPTYKVGSYEWFREGFIARGIVKRGEDLTDEQLKIALANLEALIKIVKK